MRYDVFVVNEQVAYPRAMAQVSGIGDRLWAAGVLLVFGGLIGYVLWPHGTSCGGSSAKAQCLSNLKSIGVASAMYAADNDGQVPVASWYTSEGFSWTAPSSTFEQLFAPYIGPRSDVFRCPSDLELKASPRAGESWYEAYGSSYRFIPDLSQLRSFGTSKDANTTVFARDVEAFHVSASQAWTNALFYDGHAKVLNLTMPNKGL
ncbi:MAG TPA: hypothetical protein VK171_04225 [Fimbriimonas sp.]|nr:hypothetical protein [Fimbriimonas sp.]